jgi:hypothetical protein
VADYSVFLDVSQWPEAVNYYNTYGSDGPRQVKLPPNSFDGDLLTLLKQISDAGNQFILIVTHANPNGMAMHLVKRAKNAKAAAFANNSSLCLLMEMARIRAGLETIGKIPKDRQRVEDWDELLKRIMRPEDRKEHPLKALLAEGEPSAFQADVQHRKQERAKLKAAREKIASAPGGHRSELAELEKSSEEYEAGERDEAEKAVNNWLQSQRHAMDLSADDLDNLLDAMKSAQAVKPKDIQIRGCRLGQKEDTMKILLRFFGADHLVAPEVKTIFGTLRPRMGSQFLQHRSGPKSPGICGKDDLIKPSGCWWSFDDGFRMTVKWGGGTLYLFDSAADSQDTVVDWVKNRFGPTRTGLRDEFPIHMLFSAPPAFPLESAFAAQMNEISQSA